MGTLRSVAIRSPSKGTKTRPAVSGPASGERCFEGGAVLPRASAASTAVQQRGPGHRAPFEVISRQARHTRSPKVSSHASGGAAPVIGAPSGGGIPTTAGSSTSRLGPPPRREHLGIGQNRHFRGRSEIPLLVPRL